jgi:Pectate lyase superfamily protein
MKRFFAAILASLLACHAPAYAQPYPHQPQSDGLTATGANGGVISGQAFINWFASPPCIGCTTPGLGVFSDRARSLQSFGARGDGVTDDTAAFQTALNSGIR